MKSVFTFLKTIKSLNINKLAQLFQLSCLHPFFTILSFFATIKTIRITEREFPGIHSGNGVENAFRHALWASMVMMYCCKISSPEKAKKWCQDFTGLHENLFPNTPLEQKMDLHNNNVGIRLFMEMLEGIHRQFFESSFLIDELKKKIKTAQIFLPPEDVSEENLVYIDSSTSLLDIGNEIQ